MHPSIVTIEAHFKKRAEVQERFPETWHKLEEKLFNLNLLEQESSKSSKPSEESNQASASSNINSEITNQAQKLIKQKFAHLLENRLRGNISENKNYRNIFVTAIDIFAKPRTMTLNVKISEAIFSYFGFEVDFIKSSISSYLSEIFTEILDLKDYQSEIEYFIKWTVEISQSYALWNKRKNAVTNLGKFFTTPGFLRLAIAGSSLLFCGVLLQILMQGELAITIRHEIPTDFSIEVNPSPLEVDVNPLNIDLENHGCQCGCCDRCVPTCNPC